MRALVAPGGVVLAGGAARVSLAALVADCADRTTKRHVALTAAWDGCGTARKPDVERGDRADLHDAVGF